MRSALVGSALTAVLMNWVCLAQEPQSPQAEFEALVKAQRDAQAAFNKAYAAAKTNEEKQQVVKEYGGRSPQQQGASFAALIEKYPNDPVAIKALDWLFQRDPGGQATATAIRAVGDDIIKSPEIAQLCWILGDRSGQNADS
jgi:hypothetical protein